MIKALSVVFGLILGVAFFIPVSVFASTAVLSPLASFVRVNSSYSNTPSIGTTNAGVTQEWFYKAAASHNICSVTIPLRAQGTPTDSIQLKFYFAQNYTSGAINFTTPTTVGISGLTPANATYKQSNVASWQIRSTSFEEVTFSFSPCLIVVGGSGYWFELSRTGTASATNYYQAGGYVDGGGSSYAFTGAETEENWLFQSYTYAGPTYTIPGSHSMAQIVLSGTENFGAVSASSTPSFAQSIINTILGINETNATNTVASSTSPFANLPAYYAQRVPWGYLFAIRDIYTSAATSSSEFGAIAFDFADSGMSTATRAWLPSSITVFSTTTVTHYLNGTLLAAGNTLAAAITWLTMIGYWFRRVQTV